MLSLITNSILVLLFLIPINDINDKSIIVSITNSRNLKGQLIVSLYNSKASFPKKPFKRKIIKLIKGKKPIISFNSLKAGDYAVSIVHDKNSNGKLDFHFWGPPSEKTYSSNNAKGVFGPPDWEDAKFRIVNKRTNISIRI